MWGGEEAAPTDSGGWGGRDRIPIHDELQSHTPGLPNYEGVSIALASFLWGKGAGAHLLRA